MGFMCLHIPPVDIVSSAVVHGSYLEESRPRISNVLIALQRTVSAVLVIQHILHLSRQLAFPLFYCTKLFQDTIWYKHEFIHDGG